MNDPESENAPDLNHTGETLEQRSRLIELSYEPIFTWELDGGILTWSRGCEQLYGFYKAEAIGRSSHTLLNTKHPEAFETIRDKLLQEGSWTGELRHRTKDGREVIVESRHQLMQSGERWVVLETNIEQREQERAQIARDLHDGPVQDLTGATFTLQTLADSAQDGRLAAELVSLRETLQKLIVEMRAYAGELRPPTLSKFGLEKAIRSHADLFQEKHPEIKLTLEMRQAGDLLPEAIRIAFYRIYQEGLNNVLKHANAGQIGVHFMKLEHQAMLEIHDNGRGFEVSRDWLELARRGHLGLVGMRERAEAMGGTLEIQSAPGQGTTLRVTVPL